MATYEEVMSALRKADAAGATEDAARLAQMARSLKSETIQATEPTTGEKVLGHPITRAVLGASTLLTGPLQLGANIGDKISEAMGNEPVVGKFINEKLAQIEAVKRRGMAARSGNKVGEDWDVAGGLGQMASGMAALKNLPVAATLGQKVLQGAGAGAGLSAATPVVNGGEDFFAEKGIQVGTGAVAGGAVPIIVSGAKAVGRGVRDTSDLFLPGGAKRIANRYQDKIVGQEGRQAVVDRLLQSKEIVPGSKPTAADVLSDLPEGSPIVAHQRIVAETPAGVSAEFGKRAISNEAARKAALEARDAITTPMRESAISLANKGGVKSSSVLGSINKIQSEPGLRASEVVGKTLSSVEDKINRFTNENGVIDANDLYMIRKEIGNTIQAYSKESANFDKRLSAKLQAQIQEGIDDAIENAGGKGWKNYLAEFSTRTGQVSDDALRSENMYNPVQKTALQGGVNVADETRTHVPQMLSRPAMIANAILRYAGLGIEPKVDRIMAGRYLNPEQLGREMQKLTPSQRSKVINALVQKSVQASPAQIARQQGE